MKRLPIALLSMILATAIVAAQSDERKRITEATEIMSEMINAGDKAVPKRILENAVGIAVFPGLFKAGFVVGGQHGNGIVSVRDEKTGNWSSPAFLSLSGGSFGAQIGASQIDLILVVKDRKGFQQLVDNQFKLGAEAGVAAGPVGREATAETDVQMRAKILSYSRSRGLFAGITLNGSTIHEDRDANEHFYGTPYKTGQIIFDHLGGSPEPVAGWISALNRYSATR